MDKKGVRTTDFVTAADKKIDGSVFAICHSESYRDEMFIATNTNQHQSSGRSE